MPNKTVEIVSDVPFSMPDKIDVILDLPTKRFSTNPKIAAVVVLAVVGAGVYAGTTLLKKRRKAKVEAEANAELDKVAKAAEKIVHDDNKSDESDED